MRLTSFKFHFDLSLISDTPPPPTLYKLPCSKYCTNCTMALCTVQHKHTHTHTHMEGGSTQQTNWRKLWSPWQTLVPWDDAHTLPCSLWFHQKGHQMQQQHHWVSWAVGEPHCSDGSHAERCSVPQTGPLGAAMQPQARTSWVCPCPTCDNQLWGQSPAHFRHAVSYVHTHTHIHTHTCM